MCTCIAMKTRDAYFGRSMDIEYRFGEKVVVTPRGYGFDLRNGQRLETWYAMIGMATVMGGSTPCTLRLSMRRGSVLRG